MKSTHQLPTNKDISKMNFGIENEITENIKQEEQEEQEEISSSLLIIGGIIILLLVLLFEIFNDQFFFCKDEKGKKLNCLCCDVWPVKYLRYFKKDKII